MTNAPPDELPPEPVESGVEPAQQIASDEQARALVRTRYGSEGLEPYPLTGAIRELQDAGVRGQAGMALLYASTRRIESELDTMRAERDVSRRESNQWMTMYFDEKEERAVLGERLQSSVRLKLLQNVMLTLGGLIIGIAAPMIQGAVSGWPIAGTVLGGCLLISGWLLPRPPKVRL